MIKSYQGTCCPLDHAFQFYPWQMSVYLFPEDFSRESMKAAHCRAIFLYSALYSRSNAFLHFKCITLGGHGFLIMRGVMVGWGVCGGGGIAPVLSLQTDLPGSKLFSFLLVLFWRHDWWFLFIYVYKHKIYNTWCNQSVCTSCEPSCYKSHEPYKQFTKGTLCIYKSIQV